MWILSWKTYKNCGAATTVSVIGALVRYAGVMFFAGMLIPAGLICVVLGIAFHFWAESIAKKKYAKIANQANNANFANTATQRTNTAKPASNAQTPPPAQTTASAAQTSAQTSASAQSNTATNGKIKCSRCGNLTASTNKFCNSCGNTLVPEPPKPKKCLRCGKILTADDKFCGQCGYQIK